MTSAVVTGAAMDVAIEPHAKIVDGVAVEHVVVKIPRRSQAVKGPADGNVAGNWTIFGLSDGRRL